MSNPTSQKDIILRLQLLSKRLSVENLDYNKREELERERDELEQRVRDYRDRLARADRLHLRQLQTDRVINRLDSTNTDDRMFCLSRGRLGCSEAELEQLVDNSTVNLELDFAASPTDDYLREKSDRGMTGFVVQRQPQFAPTTLTTTTTTTTSRPNLPPPPSPAVQTATTETTAPMSDTPSYEEEEELNIEYATAPPPLVPMTTSVSTAFII